MLIHPSFHIKSLTRIRDYGVIASVRHEGAGRGGNRAAASGAGPAGAARAGQFRFGRLEIPAWRHYSEKSRIFDNIFRIAFPNDK
jgi:hypothetical protein